MRFPDHPPAPPAKTPLSALTEMPPQTRAAYAHSQACRQARYDAFLAWRDARAALRRAKQLYASADDAHVEARRLYTAAKAADAAQTALA